MARLEDVCIQITDGSHNPPTSVEKSKYLMISSKNIDDDCITLNNPRYLSKEDFDTENKRTNIEPGDLLMTIVGTIGRVAIMPNSFTKICVQRSVAVLKPKSDIVYNRFLMYYLQSMRPYLERESRGVAQKGIYLKQIGSLTIFLPPLDEQRKIAAVLDKVSDLIAKRRQQLDKLDMLVKARFVEMFGDFVYDRNRWQICEIGDVADTIDPQPSHRTPPISSDGVPYIGIAECNYKTHFIDFDKARKVGQNVLMEHLERYSLSEGDFIIGKIGTIGKPFFIPAKQNYTLSANTVLIKPIKDKIVPQFLFAIFQSEYMGRIIDAEKKSTSQPAFGIQKVRRIEIPMPPMALQEQFAAFGVQVDKLKLAIQRSCEELETLKKALMQKYFK